MRPGDRRLDDHHHESRNGEHRADAVRDGVRDLLADRVLRRDMALDRSRRRLDGGADRRHGALGARSGSLKQALRPRCRVGARYGNRGGRDNAVRDGVRDLLADRVLRRDMALDRSRRRLDGGADRRHGALGARSGSLKQALRPRCRVGARYGNRGGRDIGSRQRTVTRVRHVV